ncbi:hypothetical protein RHGRI_010341 [Rhododendron griersonianum]|uniref:J domain-containing protein n=1 Tax=Rhododendron griersonianum TaxID=479676 RepID=A0AAV6KI56_9ERIC|nr:hypothetical protein RHGRI_010341 [Rhododendron griersonianum]
MDTFIIIQVPTHLSLSPSLCVVVKAEREVVEISYECLKKKRKKPIMQSYLWVGPASVDGGGGMISPCANRSLLVGPRRRRWAPVVASAAVNGGKSHYAVLGISPSASSGDIKKAYRLLALKLRETNTPYKLGRLKKEAEFVSNYPL